MINTRMNNTNLGTGINMTTTWYTFPSDGYVFLNMSASSGDRVYVVIGGPRDDSHFFTFGDHNNSNYPGVALFVRKGLRGKVTIKEGGGSATYFPLD